MMHCVFVFRKKRCKATVVSPSDDTYYYWLMVIGAAVLYNWTLLVVRSETITVAIHNTCTYINNCDVIRYVWNNMCNTKNPIISYIISMLHKLTDPFSLT